MSCYGLPHLILATLGLGVSLISVFIPWTTHGGWQLSLYQICIADLACADTYKADYFLLTVAGFVVTGLSLLMGWAAHCRAEKGGCGHRTFVAGTIVGAALLVGAVFVYYRNLDDLGWLSGSIPDSIKDDLLIDFKHITFDDLQGPFCIIVGSALSLISVPLYCCCGYEPRYSKQQMVASQVPYVPMV